MQHDEFRINNEWRRRSDAFAAKSDVRMAQRRNPSASVEKIRKDISTGKLGEFVVCAKFRGMLSLLYVDPPSTAIYSVAQRSHDADLEINFVPVSIKTCEIGAYEPSWVFQDTDIASWDHARKPVVILVSIAGEYAGIHGIVSSRFAVANLEATRKQIANKKALYEKRVPLPWREGSASISDLCLSTREGDRVYRAVLRWRERCAAHARTPQLESNHFGRQERERM